MRINVVYNKNLNVGDVIQTVDGAGTFYMIIQTKTSKYALLDLKESQIASQEYNSINEIIENFFGSTEIKSVSKDKVELTINF